MSITIIILSIITKSITHPVSFISIIISQTLLICLTSSIYTQSPWFALVLFLIFLGGVMVLFIYISRLASNENFLWEQTEFKLSISLFLIIVILTSRLYFYPLLSLNNKLLLPLNFIYSIKFSSLIICLILYLLITILVVSRVIKKNKSPIRSLK